MELKENKAAEKYVAPPLEEMDAIPGYGVEIVDPNAKFVPPPPSYAEATNNPERYDIGDQLGEEEARQILVNYAKSRCCWCTGAAEGMIFRNVQSTTAMHYTLKTFLETRSTDWKSVPYKGQSIDGPQNGTPPMPWDISVPVPSWFSETKHKCEVPHTASVKSCHKCRGSGSVTCTNCHGNGEMTCSTCFGTRRVTDGDDEVTCDGCHGTGMQTCSSCIGTGKQCCPTCRGAGKLKCFIELKVTFKNHVKDFILERTPLPDLLVRKATGKLLFEDTQRLLNPVQSCPEQEVNANSALLIQEHQRLAKSGRILMQHHAVRSVPVCQCDCTWRSNAFQYFVYGDNRLVHAPDYPQRCRCTCTIQ